MWAYSLFSLSAFRGMCGNQIQIEGVSRWILWYFWHLHSKNRLWKMQMNYGGINWRRKFMIGQNGERIEELSLRAAELCLPFECPMFQLSAFRAFNLISAAFQRFRLHLSTRLSIVCMHCKQPFLPSPLPLPLPFFSLLSSNSPLSPHFCLSIKTSIRLGLILKIGDYQVKTSSCWLSSSPTCWNVAASAGA